jgi:hypothetical protein
MLVQNIFVVVADSRLEIKCRSGKTFDDWTFCNIQDRSAKPFMSLKVVFLINLFVGDYLV